MPDAETQHELFDTNYHVAIQCNLETEEDDIIITEITLHPELVAKPRFITTQRRKARRVANTSVSEVNIAKFPKNARRKGVGTREVATQKDELLTLHPIKEDEEMHIANAPDNIELDLEILREVRINALNIAEPNHEESSAREVQAEVPELEECEAEKQWKANIKKRTTTKLKQGICMPRESRHVAMVENTFLDKNIKPGNVPALQVRAQAVVRMKTNHQA